MYKVILFSLLLTCLICFDTTNVNAQKIVSKNAPNSELVLANNRFARGRAKYKIFIGLYNDAVTHGNSDFLHNEKYILTLLDSSNFYCIKALTIYKSFEEKIDQTNRKTLHNNIVNTEKVLADIKKMQEKMRRFYAAAPGKSMRELTR